MISEKGTNLSVGQRQVVCIARALINRAKILLMDEATASVDKRLDKSIQEVLKTEFSESTIITIAHRLETVLNYQKIVVIDEGRKAEEGAPEELYKAQGIFYGMIREANLGSEFDD